MPRLVTGNFTDKIIHACWVIGPNTSEMLDTTGVVSWKAPAKCVLLAYDETTGTAMVQGSIRNTATTTGVAFILTNTTEHEQLLYNSVSIGSGERHAQDGVLVTTQTRLVLDRGDIINADITVVKNEYAPLLVQAYLYGV